ncbi:hypothetical protein GCM10011519_17980 [Marmoricola endophyticus]|uniref:DAGKc domain-containing protein n=1 Tax=Marmoricola endophyticus TaxID=2040280 RepID=A0A917BGS4_9ACTN|nr:diacylglycerol kinase family protein [Marmoricola endophyticus]GGF44500.1 hypothetical protein GCM10011519_17980 [Marmoricola endophyticus]
MDPLLLIANAGAGSAEREALEQALAVLRAETDVEVARTSSPGDLDGVLHRAASRTIVVAGGDGSLHAVVAALHRRHDLGRSTLALLPMGTGNDFARGNQIPLDPAEAARLVLVGDVRPVDLLVDEVGEVVVNNVHAGASAQASRRGARWKHRLGRVGVGRVNLGKLGYPIGVVLAAVRPPFVRLRVEVDGDVLCDVDRHVLMVAVGNGSTVGGGAEVNPDATTEDGVVDIVLSLATGPLARFGYVTDLLRTRQTERDDVLHRTGSRVTISGEPFWCSADGEVYGPERHRAWRVEKAAYSMVLPPR